MFTYQALTFWLYPEKLNSWFIFGQRNTCWTINKKLVSVHLCEIVGWASGRNP